ncbi:hypothetical protein [Streptosporangium saharense]|uniref:hypothetical protein n=1 Tax=Streptosporangium saharense TaxID=1706840 RepID=UPI0036B3330D
MVEEGPLKVEISPEHAQSLVAFAAERVNRDVMRTSVDLLSETVRRALLGQVKMGAAKTLPDSGLDLLMKHLRLRRAAAGILSHWLTGTLGTHRFKLDDYVTHLTPGASLGDYVFLIDERFPLPMIRWGLAVAVQQGLPGAPLALGLLTAEAHELGEDASRILDMNWSRLRETEPLLPERPAGLAELIERQRAVRLELALREEQPGKAATESGEPAEPGDTGSGCDGADGETKAVTSPGPDEVRAAFSQALVSAENIIAALKEETPPSAQDLDEIRRAREDFFTFHARVVKEDGCDVEPTLAALEERLATRRENARLTELHGLAGPERYAEALADVHAAIGNPESVVELTLLRDLLDSAVLADTAEFDELSERAHQEFPVGWRKLINPIGRGTITLVTFESDELNESAEPLVRAESPPDPGPQLLISPAIPDLDHEEVPEKDPVITETTLEEVVAEDHILEEEADSGRDAVQVELSADALRAEIEALSSDRLALAAWIRVADGRPEAEIRARHAALLAAEVNEFTSKATSAFTERIRRITVRDLASDPGGQLMLFTAVLRAGLASPTYESTELLEELTPVFAGFDGLHECGRAFAQAARGGAHVVSGDAAAIRDVAGLELDRRNRAREAKSLMDVKSHRTLSYQKATEVLKRLLQDDQPMAMALQIASDDEAARRAEARDIVEKLRARGAVEKLIDDATRELFRGGKKRIEAGARSRLDTHIRQICDAVLEWSEAAQACQAVRDRLGADKNSTTSALASLREEIRPWRDRAQADVHAFGARFGVPTTPASGLLQQAFGLLDGQNRAGTGRPVADLFNRDLLLVPDLRLSQALEPVRSPTVAELLPVALATVPDWLEAFNQRAVRLDHEGTFGVVDCVERFDALLGVELRRRRDDMVRKERGARDDRIEALRDRIATWLRDGVLTEPQMLNLEKRLQDLGGDRCDFDVVSGLLDDVDGELEETRDRAMKKVLDRLERVSEHNPLLRDAVSRVRETVETGDLTTANEIIEQAIRGNAPARAPGRPEHFVRFFPAFPRVCHDIAIRSGNRARRTESRELLKEVAGALRTGTHPADPEVRSLFHHAGIDIPALRPTRRDDLRAVLGSWQQIAQGKKTAGAVRTWVERILRLLGVEGEQIPAEEDQHGVWIDLTGVRLTGQPLLPAFGSEMSPSGDSLRLLLLWRSPGAKEIIDLLKGEPVDRTVLVLYFGLLSTEQRMALARSSRDRPTPVAGVVDDAMIAYLASMEERDWAVTVSLMAPFTSTNPYRPNGDVPDEMFMGRDRQLDQVIDRAGSSFVYGGRQLGKSALLRMAKNMLHSKDPGRVVILQSIQEIGKGWPVEQLWPDLGNQLAGRGVIPEGVNDREGVCAAIRSWCEEDPSRQLLILLDEVDSFLAEDARHGGFPNVITLRELMQHTERRVKVVFAGLHQTGRFLSLSNQPLVQLGAPIAIGPLLPQHAFNLLVSPLATLGFRMPENLAARIIAETNNAPALVQLFAQDLLARLQRDPREVVLPYEITRADVEAVWRDPEVVQGIKKLFEMTIALDKRYKVIAYVVALYSFGEGFDAMISAADLRKECEGCWPQGFADCGVRGFRDLLEECVSLGVLRAEGDRYGLRTPYILRLLGGVGEVEKVLDEAATLFELPDSFDANSYRAGLDGHEHECSPLTAGQMASLLGSRGGLQIVTGSGALRIDRVVTALEEAHTKGRKWIKADSHNLVMAVMQAEQVPRSSAVIYSPGPGDPAELVYERLSRIRASAEGPLVIAVLPARLSALWHGQIVELGRFNRVGIRQWLNEIHALHNEDAESVLRVTSGWPTLVHLVADNLRLRAGLGAALTECRSHLEDSAADFVASTGVNDHPVLAAAWSVLVTEEDIYTAADLAELLRIYGESGEPLLRDPETHGFDGTEGIVEALRLLGALEPRTDQQARKHPGSNQKGLRLTCEPVLRAATLRARR